MRRKKTYVSVSEETLKEWAANALKWELLIGLHLRSFNRKKWKKKTNHDYMLQRHGMWEFLSNYISFYDLLNEINFSPGIILFGAYWLLDSEVFQLSNNTKFYSQFWGCVGEVTLKGESRSIHLVFIRLHPSLTLSNVSLATCFPDKFTLFFLLLFNYSCIPFLPIPPPHPRWTPLPPPPPPSPLVLSMCPL